MTVSQSPVPTLDAVSAALLAHLEELVAMGVESIGVFGSVARGDATERSDIDLLVQLRRPAGFFAYAALEERLGEILGGKVDVVPATSLPPHVRERVERDLCHIL